MHENTITLKGEAARPDGVTFRVLQTLVPVVSNTCRRVLRFQAEGRSHLMRVPNWLNEVTDLELATHNQVSSDANSTRLVIKSPTLLDVAPQLFEQLPLFEASLRSQDTAFNLFEEALLDAVNGNANSARIDSAILSSAAEFSDVLDLGFSSISLNGGPRPAVHITRETLKTVEQLQKTAPESKKVVISGRLDSLTGSRRSFSLITGGRTIRGYFPTEDNDRYKDLWDKRVVIDGDAVFKPSGEFSFVIANYIQPAGDNDDIWESIPRSSPRTLDDVTPRTLMPPMVSGAGRVFGKWPGDETDEEVMATLEAID